MKATRMIPVKIEPTATPTAALTYRFPLLFNCRSKLKKSRLLLQVPLNVS